MFTWALSAWFVEVEDPPVLQWAAGLTPARWGQHSLHPPTFQRPSYPWSLPLGPRLWRNQEQRTWEKNGKIQYMCMWPLWVRIKHLDGWVNQLKKIQKRNLSLIYISIHGWIWVSRLVTVALSGRAQFLRHPAHSRQSRTPRWRCRTGSDSELWSEPHRWGRHSDWTTTGCRLEKVTKMKKCMIFLLNTDLKVGVL